MININLLPDALRKKERMPLPHFLGMIGGLVLFGGLIYMITKYQFDTIPALERRVEEMQRQRDDLRRKADELKTVNAEIGKLSGYVEAVKTLYRNRVVWSKILSDIKNITNYDSEMSAYNADMRYLWYTNLSGKGKLVQLRGFATASSQVVAMQMPERLLERFRSFSTTELPEAGEELRLQEELKNAVAEYENLRRVNPDLPVQGPKEITVRQRLEEIKRIKSGGIALQPFHTLLKPNSITLVNASWVSAPPPRRREPLTEIFPSEAWNFDIRMELK